MEKQDFSHERSPLFNQLPKKHIVKLKPQRDTVLILGKTNQFLRNPMKL